MHATRDHNTHYQSLNQWFYSINEFMLHNHQSSQECFKLLPHTAKDAELESTFVSLQNVHRITLFSLSLSLSLMVKQQLA